MFITEDAGSFLILLFSVRVRSLSPLCSAILRLRRVDGRGASMRLLLLALLAATVECGKAGGRYRRVQRIAAQQRPHHNLSNTDYRSVGKLEPLAKVFDMAERGVPRKVAAQRSYRGEIMLFTSDASMAGWSFHFVSQLRARGYEHWLILADKKVRWG